MKKLIKKSNEVANNLESYYDYGPGYFCGSGSYCYCSDGTSWSTVQSINYSEAYANS